MINFTAQYESILKCWIICILFYCFVNCKEMRIWDLSTNEKDAVTFFQEKSILPKKRVCGFAGLVTKENCISENNFFWKCNFKS